MMQLETIANNNILSEKGREGQVYFYLIADAVGIPSLAEELSIFEGSYEILFPQDYEEDLAEVSPYIIEVNADTKSYCERLFATYYNKHSLIFCHSYVGLESLAQHFRSYTSYLLPESKEQVMVAFYDARVLPGFVNALDTEQLSSFMEPVIALYGEDERDASVMNSWGGEASFFVPQWDSEEIREFSQENVDKLELHEEQRMYLKMAKSLKELYADSIDGYDIPTLESMAKVTTEKMKTHKLDKYNQFFQLFAWEVFYGKDYEQKKTSVKLMNVLKTDLPSDEKFELYKTTIENYSLQRNAS